MVVFNNTQHNFVFRSIFVCWDIFYVLLELGDDEELTLERDWFNSDVWTFRRNRNYYVKFTYTWAIRRIKTKNHFRNMFGKGNTNYHIEIRWTTRIKFISIWVAWVLGTPERASKMSFDRTYRKPDSINVENIIFSNVIRLNKTFLVISKWRLNMQHATAFNKRVRECDQCLSRLTLELGQRVVDRVILGLGQRVVDLFTLRLDRGVLYLFTLELCQGVVHLFSLTLGQRVVELFTLWRGQVVKDLSTLGLGQELIDLSTNGLGQMVIDLSTFGLGQEIVYLSTIGLGKEVTHLYSLWLGQGVVDLYTLWFSQRVSRYNQPCGKQRRRA